MTLRARLLAREYHEGQMYGNHLYVKHLTDVKTLAMTLFGHQEGLAAAAYLHDILEDTKATRDTLLEAGISQEVVEAVELLTKDRTLSYFENIQRIINSGNLLAIRVKFCDNMANYSAYDPSGKKNKVKYHKSMEMLREHIWNN